MILAVDVDYRDSGAVVAGVLFEHWKDNAPAKIVSTIVSEINPYISGEFYKRELPCILALLDEIDESLDAIIVDGYVFLDSGKKGLGAHLYDALKHKIPVIGVAKNAFKDINEDTFVYRGESKKPLYVTSVGIANDEAKAFIQKMHGKYRFPTLLKMVDRQCRSLNIKS